MFLVGFTRANPPPPPPQDPPLLKDWTKFSSGPLANQTFSLSPSAPVGLDQKLSSAPLAPLKPQHHGGGGGGGGGGNPTPFKRSPGGGGVRTALAPPPFVPQVGLQVKGKLAFNGTGYRQGQGPGYEELRGHVQQIKATPSAKPFALVFCTLEDDGMDAARLVSDLDIDVEAVWISVAPLFGRFTELLRYAPTDTPRCPGPALYGRSVRAACAARF